MQSVWEAVMMVGVKHPLSSTLRLVESGTRYPSYHWFFIRTLIEPWVSSSLLPSPLALREGQWFPGPLLIPLAAYFGFIWVARLGESRSCIWGCLRSTHPLARVSKHLSYSFLNPIPHFIQGLDPSSTKVNFRCTSLDIKSTIEL